MSINSLKYFITYESLHRTSRNAAYRKIRNDFFNKIDLMMWVS
jgi:hypothetical protein